MMFGKPVAAQVIPKVTAGTVELAGVAADEDKPNESTVRVDLGMDDAHRVVLEGEAPNEEPARHDRTQRFAMDEMGGGPTPPEGENAVQARHNRTQLFAMSTGQEVTDAAGRAVPDSRERAPADAAQGGDSSWPRSNPGRRSQVELQADLATTLPPDAPVPPMAPRARFDPPGITALGEPGAQLPVAGDAIEPGAVASTLPSLPPIDSRPLMPLPLELPPEPSGSPRELLAAQQRLEAERAAQAQRAPAHGGGAGRVVVILLALIALVLAGVLVWRLLVTSGKLQAPQLGRASTSAADALATLRRDDWEAQEQAAASVRPFLERPESVHEARAVLVLVAAFRLDDVRALTGFDEEKARLLERALGRGGEEAAVARARLETLAGELDRQRAQVKERREALEAELTALRALPPPEGGSPAELAVLRAEAIARGVLGDGEALAVAERARQLARGPDDWAELAEPEYALNGGASLDEARSVLDALRKRQNNSTFVRPIVLSARMHLLNGDGASAREELDQVVLMNKKHRVAERLLATLSSTAGN
jgi:hypothetical protein